MAKKQSAPYAATDIANADALASLTGAKKKTKTETVSDEEATQSLTAKVGDLVPMRRWYCRNRMTKGCQGALPFLAWTQLLDKPTCPNCGQNMFWHQWGVRVQ